MWSSWQNSGSHSLKANHLTLHQLVVACIESYLLCISFGVLPLLHLWLKKTENLLLHCLQSLCIFILKRIRLSGRQRVPRLQIQEQSVSVFKEDAQVLVCVMAPHFVFYETPKRAGRQVSAAISAFCDYFPAWFFFPLLCIAICLFSFYHIILFLSFGCLFVFWLETVRGWNWLGGDAGSNWGE